MARSGFQQREQCLTPTIISKTNSLDNNRESAGGSPTSLLEVEPRHIAEYGKIQSPIGLKVF